MARYVLLISFTDKGIAAIQQSPQRADAFRDLATKHGCTIEQQLWTMGAYDGVVIMKAPSDEAITAMALSLGQVGAVRSTTLRAFDEAEFHAILKKM